MCPRMPQDKKKICNPKKEIVVRPSLFARARPCVSLAPTAPLPTNDRRAKIVWGAGESGVSQACERVSKQSIPLYYEFLQPIEEEPFFSWNNSVVNGRELESKRVLVAHFLFSKSKSFNKKTEPLLSIWTKYWHVGHGILCKSRKTSHLCEALFAITGGFLHCRTYANNFFSLPASLFGTCSPLLAKIPESLPTVLLSILLERESFWARTW